MIHRERSAEELFGAALEIPPERRSAFLDEACSSPDLRQLVEQLLKDDERAGSFLGKPLFTPDETVSLVSRDRPPADFLARFQSEELIANRFEVVRFIARGGMGEVYEVRDRYLQGVNVALKIIRPEIAGDAGSAKRFEQEVILARKVSHPNLCPIYDISRCDQPAPSFLFLTMKLLRGQTLEARIRDRKPPSAGEVSRPPLKNGDTKSGDTKNGVTKSGGAGDGDTQDGDSLEICRQLLRGVSALHNAGIVHRDIKPNNIILEETPEHAKERFNVSIMDFGLARLHQVEPATGQSVTIAGTVGYMAPELLRGQPPSKATDLFALGVVMHQVLTGERPVESPTDLSLALRPSMRFMQAPAYLVQAVEQFLSANPEVRTRGFEEVQSAESGAGTGPIPPPPVSSSRRWIWAAAVIAVAGASLAIWANSMRTPGLLHSEQITFSPEEKQWPLRSDGSRLYFQSGAVSSEMALNGGVIVPVPTLEPGMQVRDIAADATRLVAWQPDPGNEVLGGLLWLASSVGGTPRKISPYIAQDARWSTDGSSLFSAEDHAIYACAADGTNRRKIWQAPDLISDLALSPDGRELTVTLVSAPSSQLWRLKADGTGAHPLLPDWPIHADQQWGAWTSDGKHFVFVSDREGRNNVYELVSPRWFEFWKKPTAVLMTGNQITIRALTAARDKANLLVLGEMDQGAMQVFDLKTGKRVQFMDESSKLSFVISPDGQWMAYNEYPSGNLWKSRLDGSQALQLTSAPAYMQKWSPDGKNLVYTDWRKLYLVSADGGTPEKLLADGDGEVAPTWTPDGKSIAFNHYNERDEPTEGIQLVDVATRKLSMMPGSKGLYVASWSPDGKYLLALAQNPARMMLYTAATGAWTNLKEFDLLWGFWIWSKDSRSIYMEIVQGQNGIYKLTVPDGKWEKVVGLNGVHTRQEDAYPSLTADGQIAVMSHTGVAQVYSLSWTH